jgi:hypothetical protein
MIDPTCVFHGKKASEHQCLYCCLCFKTITPDECHMTDAGVKEDVCEDCAARENQLVLYLDKDGDHPTES